MSEQVQTLEQSGRFGYAMSQAQRNKATAELAAGDAGAVPAALPGGSADKRLTGQESIGDLIRAGIGPLEDDSEI